MAIKYEFRRRQYEGELLQHAWLVRIDGPARAGVLHGELSPKLVSELAETFHFLGVPVAPLEVIKAPGDDSDDTAGCRTGGVDAGHGGDVEVHLVPDGAPVPDAPERGAEGAPGVEAGAPGAGPGGPAGGVGSRGDPAPGDGHVDQGGRPAGGEDGDAGAGCHKDAPAVADGFAPGVEAGPGRAGNKGRRARRPAGPTLC